MLKETHDNQTSSFKDGKIKRVFGVQEVTLDTYTVKERCRQEHELMLVDVCTKGSHQRE